MIALLAIFPGSRARSLGQENRLFQETEKGEAGARLFSNQPAVIRSRWVQPKLEALVQGQTSGKLVLNLFEDVVYQGVLDRIQENRTGSTEYHGRLENIPMSSFVLVTRQGILMGTVRLPGALYRIDYQDGVHLIQQLDENNFPPELEPIPVESAQGDALVQGSADDGSRIDVLVVYTKEARLSGGGTTEAIEALIDTAVAETNAGYLNSGVSQRLRLVHSAEVNFNETNFNWETTLTRLKGTSDGWLDEVHTLREAYCADEVVLVVDNYDFCGLAYLMNTLSTSFADSAFAVVSKLCATGYYSFGHEMGHNMGSTHDRANASTSGVFRYSYGYQDTLEAFRTIMAYDCLSGCPRLNYWSNPEIYMYDRPMGVPDTESLAADNHMSLNNTANTVSNFRQSSVCMPYTFYLPLLQK